MRLDYDVRDGVKDSVVHFFDIDRDWSGENSLYLWYVGLAGNSLESVELRISTSSRTQCTVGTGTTQALAWTQIQGSLAACGDLSQVKWVEITVAASSSGRGTIYIDDLTLDGQVPVELVAFEVR